MSFSLFLTFSPISQKLGQIAKKNEFQIRILEENNIKEKRLVFYVLSKLNNTENASNGP